MVCYMKYLPDPTWRTRHFWFDNDAYTNLQHIRGNNKINNNKIKSRSFENMFFIHFNKQNVGVLQYRSKVSWQSRLETWFSILEVFENWVSMLENRVSRIENRVSRIEFPDTRRIYRGSRTEISRKRFNSWKQNNSDEQNNWCAALFAQTRFECMLIFFRVVHFLQGTYGSHIYTEADNSAKQT